MSYATFGDLTLADGIVTQDTDSDLVAVPLRSVDAASLSYRSNPVWVMAALIALTVSRNFLDQSSLIRL